MDWRDVFSLLAPAFSAAAYAGIATLLFARGRRPGPVLWRGRPIEFPRLMAGEFLCIAVMFTGIAAAQTWFDHEQGLMVAASALPCVGLGTSWLVRRRLVRATAAG
ncbi:hypothetical protein [Micromonospora sp. NPDC049679]|uniref:hypothetical protein n=1 Tax=Micromonospora sp. NPDC049679 TaxID=3155920 RepID=UPI003400CA4B